MKACVVDVGKVARNSVSLTVNVRLKGVRKFRFRVWLTMKLMRLAQVVCPVPMEIDESR